LLQGLLVSFESGSESGTKTVLEASLLRRGEVLDHLQQISRGCPKSAHVAHLVSDLVRPFQRAITIEPWFDLPEELHHDLAPVPQPK